MVGDGGFMMTGQELATAFHHGAAPIVLVFNNNQFGTIRMHQERAYPWRVSGTQVTNPDFAQIHRSVRRPWGNGQRDRGLRPGVPPRGGQRQALGHRTAHEPRSDHHPSHRRRSAGRQDTAARRVHDGTIQRRRAALRRP